MNNRKMGFLDYLFLIIGIGLLMLMASCSKDPDDCQTTQIGSIEKIIIKNGVNEISYSPIYETICL
tara:strand:- start:1593 stop:1790 length:198 start_codon:yes stop_codon:yes gene_type:complete